MATDPYNPSTWRLTTAGGIPYRILDVSGSSEQDTTSVTEVYLVQATSILQFIIESFPPPLVVNGIPFYRNRRLPGLPNLSTRRISWERFIDGLPIDPFQTDTVAPAKTYPDLARVTIEYSNVREPDENSFLHISGNVAGEFLHVALPKATTVNEEAGESSSSGGASGNPNTRTTLSAAQLVPEIEWTIRWDQVGRKFFKETLLPRLREALGKVNSKPWPLLFQEGERNGRVAVEPQQWAETLLFVGFTFEETFQVNALIPLEPIEESERDKIKREKLEADQDAKLPPVRLEMKFLEKRVEDYLRDSTTGQIVISKVDDKTKVTVVYGHNHIWNDDQGGWRKVYVSGKLRSLYEHYDFNKLFEPVTDSGVEDDA